MDTNTRSAAAATASALLEIAPLVEQSGDKEHAVRLRELSDKATAGKLTIAFCGHFSAGKSTLINRLCGAKLLPSSPIPTSANVVSIQGGAPCARIVSTAGGQRKVLEVPPEQLEAYCVNGEEFASVAITYPIEALGDKIVLLDTPGIDSTDGAHRMATESALHLADVVFYVMDYNHVQSEINFAFAKQLKDWGKPLYLIVNQIDKHRERELSFSAYRHSVEEAFAAWSLEPAGILYLSQREPQHPYQEWEGLELLIKELATASGLLSCCSVHASARHLLGEHAKWLEASQEQERSALVEQAGGEEGMEAVQAELTQLALLAEQRRQAPEQLRVKLRQEMESLLDNANITPAETRDLAHLFLESRKPGFKAGLFFAAAKTAAEQQRRLDAFLAGFAPKVQSSIEWHAIELFRKAAQHLGWRDDSLEQRLAEALTGVVEPSLLLAPVRAGAVFSNEFTMNYCRELAASVKSLYRKRALELIDELAARAAAAGEAAAAPEMERRAALATQAAALAQLAALDSAAAARREQLAALLPQAPALPALPVPAAAAAPAAAESRAADKAGAGAAGVSARAAAGLVGATAASGSTIAAGGGTAVATAPLAAQPAAMGAADAGRAPAVEPSSGAGANADAAMLGPQRQAAALLERAAALLAPHGMFARSAQTMQAKAARLQQSRFTIALFGAFSAGKSSFANALIGAPTLPVSPNPTTATINRIVPPTAGHPHGTARVVMKSKAAMMDDIRYSLNLLGETAEGEDERPLLKAIAGLKPAALHPGGRPHYSFLKAVLQGWELLAPQLGEQLTVDEPTYRQYVAEEWRSCFVQEIELFCACPLTEQGIVLVDTPGADSVNARHTGVAFNYIKNADAILFVTYYNHAFSQADRQFLMQLGRVKDQFELDKMFFIVNAADLASSDEELQDVLSHVEQNLVRHGIRQPRLFPVSSLQALDAKLDGRADLTQQSGIDAFEQAFLQFTAGELGQLAAASAEQEISRAVGQAASLLAAAKGDETLRAQQREELLQSAASAHQSAASAMSAASVEPLLQELRELLFYVLQRVKFRFGEHFQLAFNPAALQSDGRDLKKMIWTCWLELQRQLQNDLAEEMLATTLRMENSLKRLAVQQYAAAAAELAARLDDLSVREWQPDLLNSPEIGELWQTDQVERKLLWAPFRNPRHFFENGGSTILREELEKVLTEPMKSYTDGLADRWTENYRELWQSALQSGTANLQAEIEQYKTARLSSLSREVAPEVLEQLVEQLTALTNERHAM
ncbi:dynamin [Paenibacillaceae bacterium]|nr:dynamin [Paenibacillaceae bacterium]